jgi:hypothetical protein
MIVKAAPETEVFLALVCNAIDVDREGGNEPHGGRGKHQCTEPPSAEPLSLDLPSAGKPIYGQTGDET